MSNLPTTIVPVPVMPLLCEAVRIIFSADRFSICPINQILELTGIELTEETMAGLRIIHCQPWKDISPVVRAWVKEVVNSLSIQTAVNEGSKD